MFRALKCSDTVDLSSSCTQHAGFRCGGAGPQPASRKASMSGPLAKGENGGQAGCNCTANDWMLRSAARRALEKKACRATGG